MRIATYNANSIRSRIEVLKGWIAQNQPDVLAIQETKVQDSEFPLSELLDTGYRVTMRGQLKYNGVAILSRRPPDNVILRLEGDEKDEARFMEAAFGKIKIINTYVPQGFKIGTERFQYKLDWLGLLRSHLDRFHKPDEAIVWVGDFNVALSEIDVYDPKKMWGSVCYCQPVIDAVRRVMDWGFTDLFRTFHPEAGHYTFWDYRIPGCLTNNLGWRLDYVMASGPAVGACTDCFIDRQPRAWDKPSDHTFVAADFGPKIMTD